jgi:GTPase SAR1 family protein
MNFEDFVAKAFQRLLIYGPPKTGKTTLVGQLAEHGFKLKYFDLDAGVSSLIKNVKKEFHKNIELFQLPDQQIYPVAVDTILKCIKRNPVTICEKHGRVSCVLCAARKDSSSSFCTEDLTPTDIWVIDSVTQLSFSIMNSICKGIIEKGETPAPGWDEYKKQGFTLDRIFSYIQQADHNTICISHEASVKMEDLKIKLVPVAGTDNFSKSFGRFFDHIIHCDVINNKHHFISTSTSSNQALSGSRLNVVLDKEEKPSLLKFFEHLLPNSGITPIIKEVKNV